MGYLNLALLHFHFLFLISQALSSHAIAAGASPADRRDCQMREHYGEIERIVTACKAMTKNESQVKLNYPGVTLGKNATNLVCGLRIASATEVMPREFKLINKVMYSSLIDQSLSVDRNDKKPEGKKVTENDKFELGENRHSIKIALSGNKLSYRFTVVMNVRAKGGTPVPFTLNIDENGVVTDGQGDLVDKESTLTDPETGTILHAQKIRELNALITLHCGLKVDLTKPLAQAGPEDQYSEFVQRNN